MPLKALATNSALIKARQLLCARKIDEALRLFDEAQAEGQGALDCAAGRWMCFMYLGDLGRAWQESDFIASTGTYGPDELWHGESWDGKHVMLRCLHGLGDAIQFIRYAPLLKNTCQRLTVQAHPELVTLIEGVCAVDEVITWNELERPWDVQMEVTQLPYAFRTSLESLPATVPYIKVPDADLGVSTNMRVGLIWEASSFDTSRSVPLAELEPILSLSGFEFYALQQFVEHPVIRNVDCYNIDVRRTAALMAQMDIVISVDTMTAHLAGALGRPVWILLPERADWRWMLRRPDTPWYPTARLFRQTQQNQWADVIEQLAAELRQA